MKKRILVVAGEVSGDLHAAGLIQELQKMTSDLEFFGIGGDKMKSCGVKSLFHINQLSVLGFWEVLKHLNFFRRVKNQLLAEVEASSCHLAILVDYPGFNLRLAADLKKRSIPIVYYISPQIWAWGEKRIEKIKKYVGKMIVFFPFEEELYRRHSVKVEFVGHPSLELAIPTLSRKQFCDLIGVNESEKLIGLFPGSRIQEVKQHLPVMAQAAGIIRSQLGNFQFLVGLAPGIDKDFVKSLLPSNSPIGISEGHNYEIMKYSEILLVKSGTSTVEAALSGTPFVVMYKTSPISYFIARRVVKISNLAMANILVGKKIVPEFIQNLATPEKIATESVSILKDQARYLKIKEELQGMRGRLGTGNAYRKAAQAVAELI
jgi:lipid-A-disaccharide synthase